VLNTVESTVRAVSMWLLYFVIPFFCRTTSFSNDSSYADHNNQNLRKHEDANPSTVRSRVRAISVEGGDRQSFRPYRSVKRYHRDDSWPQRITWILLMCLHTQHRVHDKKPSHTTGIEQLSWSGSDLLRLTGNDTETDLCPHSTILALPLPSPCPWFTSAWTESSVSQSTNLSTAWFYQCCIIQV
jgi:hypothetical protein